MIFAFEIKLRLSRHYFECRDLPFQSCVAKVYSVVPPYSTWPGGVTRFGDADQFYHICIFEYCRNKCRRIILVKEGPPFCQLTLSSNIAYMPFQYYHLQNIFKVHLQINQMCSSHENLYIFCFIAKRIE